MTKETTFELYRVKRRWSLGRAGEETEAGPILSGGDNFLDRLAQFAEKLTIHVSVEESGDEGELALVSVEGSDLRGWRLFRRRDGEEAGMLSPAMLEPFGSTKVLFVRVITEAEVAE